MPGAVSKAGFAGIAGADIYFSYRLKFFTPLGGKNPLYTAMAVKRSFFRNATLSYLCLRQRYAVEAKKVTNRSEFRYKVANIRN
jgi:hypothetical protein